MEGRLPLDKVEKCIGIISGVFLKEEGNLERSPISHRIAQLCLFSYCSRSSLFTSPNLFDHWGAFPKFFRSSHSIG